LLDYFFFVFFLPDFRFFFLFFFDPNNSSKLFSVFGPIILLPKRFHLPQVIRGFIYIFLNPRNHPMFLRND